ncbi:hypothetical protein SAMN05444266_103210 [Chitinophaga jiangningensis]|uniref:Uncharacterized protein n=2 Tax=Chitinophaga jiangningensis TaxID=1419482 RepID=A0A1M7ABH8_9BACT|nr:hypothetical protein SAMN05444266_103210 [Chitinophaga jiangningensis]
MLLYACGDAKKTSTKNLAHSAAKADSAAQTITVPDLPTEQYVAEIIRKCAAVSQQLATLSPAAAAELYRSLAQYMDTAVTGISQNESKWLDTYINYYSETASKYLPPPDVEARIKLLATAGIEPWYIGEGYTELRIVPDFYTKLFGHTLPRDYQQYLQLRADEDTVLYSADAGLMIPFHDIGLRVRNWEKFLQDHPKSIFTANAREQYTYYLTDYLFGQDNTPAFDNHSDLSTLLPENKAEYTAYADLHSGTHSGAVVKLFLDTLDKVSSMDQFRDIIRDAISNINEMRVTVLPKQPEFHEAAIETQTKTTYDKLPGEVAIAEGTNEKIDRTLDTILYFRQQNNTYCMAVYKNQGSKGSAPVSGWVDVWVFKKVNDHWQLADKMLEAGGGGMYGNSGYFDKLLAFGPDATGIIINGGITHMGTSASWDDVLTFSNDKLSKAFHIVTYDAYEGPTGRSSCNSVKWYMEPGSSGEAFDLVIVPGSCMAQNTPLERIVVSARDGKYAVPAKFQETGI